MNIPLSRSRCRYRSRLNLDKRLDQAKESSSSSHSASEPPALNLSSSSHLRESRQDSVSSSSHEDDGPELETLDALKVKLEQQTSMLQMQHNNHPLSRLGLDRPDGLAAGDESASTNCQSVESLLRNIQTLLRMAAETAREYERNALIEKSE